MASPPAHLFEDTKLKIQKDVLNNLNQEIKRGFIEFLPVRWQNGLWMLT